MLPRRFLQDWNKNPSSGSDTRNLLGEIQNTELPKTRIAKKRKSDQDFQKIQDDFYAKKNKKNDDEDDIDMNDFWKLHIFLQKSRHFLAIPELYPLPATVEAILTGYLLVVYYPHMATQFSLVLEFTSKLVHLSFPIHLCCLLRTFSSQYLFITTSPYWSLL